MLAELCRNSIEEFVWLFSFVFNLHYVRVDSPDFVEDK